MTISALGYTLPKSISLSSPEAFYDKIASLVTKEGVFLKTAHGLPRSCVSRSGSFYLLQNSSKAGDKILGQGTTKKVKTAVSLLDGRLFATFSLPLKYQHELDIRALFSDTDGVQTPPICQFEYESKKGPRLRVIEGFADGDLDDLIKRGDVSLENKISITKTLLKGLKAVHDKGFLHRDIKPENILFSSSEGGQISPYISDFGLFVSHDDKASMMIQQGSPKFFSPEYVSYARSELVQSDAFLALEEEKKVIETQLKAFMGATSRPFSDYSFKKWLATQPEVTEAHTLYSRLEEVRKLKLEARSIKDFSCVTTQKHDLYALGLVIYGLFTSQEALDALISLRYDKNDFVHVELDEHLPEALKVLVKGLLEQDPSARFGWDEILTLRL